MDFVYHVGAADNKKVLYVVNPPWSLSWFGSKCGVRSQGGRNRGIGHAAVPCEWLFIHGKHPRIPPLACSVKELQDQQELTRVGISHIYFSVKKMPLQAGN